MRFRSVVAAAWRYCCGSWVLPASALVIGALALRDALVPQVPLWVGFFEFPLFLFAIFAPFVDAARREDRWHASRGRAWREPAKHPGQGWWARQFGFLVRQVRRPAWWAPVAFKLLILLTVARLVPSAVPYVALLPNVITIAALVSIVTSGWRRQQTWDRFAPGDDLPIWAQRRIDRWPLTAASAGFLLAALSGAMSFYFFSMGNWPVELLCSVQCFWVAVASVRILAPGAPWRSLATTPRPTTQVTRAA